MDSEGRLHMPGFTGQTFKELGVEEADSLDQLHEIEKLKLAQQTIELRDKQGHLAASFLNNAEVIEAEKFLGYAPVNPEMQALYEQQLNARIGNRHARRKAEALARKD